MLEGLSVHDVYPHPITFGAVKLYTGELKVSLPFDGFYKGLEELYAEVTLPDGNVVQIYIPGGFKSDLASSKIAKALLDYAYVKYAAYIHDWLYESGLLSREIADLVFLIVCNAGEKSRYRRSKNRIAYRLVKLCGGRPYQRYREKREIRNEDITQLVGISYKRIKAFNLGYLDVE